MYYKNLPHWFALHFSEATCAPVHFAPPFDGGGSSHFLLRSLLQVFFAVSLLHGPGGPHFPHFPSTTHKVQNCSYMAMYYSMIKLDLKNISKVYRLPLHILVLQTTSTSEVPVHCLPPLDAGIFMALVFVRLPPAQLFEHDVHSSQSCHTQSTVIRKNGT